MAKKFLSKQASESDRGSGMAGRTDEDLATDALTYLGGGSDSVQGLHGDTQEIDRQSACLVEWARKRKVLLKEDFFSNLQKVGSETAEHEVFFRKSDNRAIKRTRAGNFGVTPKQDGAPSAATPIFYLHRLKLLNQVFFAGLEMEGVILGISLIIGQTGELPSIVISQPWIPAANVSHPNPSQKAINAFMMECGFTALKGSYFGWYRVDDGITVLDARPDNFIQSSEGVVPIDLVIKQNSRKTYNFTEVYLMS